MMGRDDTNAVGMIIRAPPFDVDLDSCGLKAGFGPVCIKSLHIGFDFFLFMKR